MSEYRKRLAAPTATDKHWLHYSVGGYNHCLHIGNGSCLPNCVGYAWGRWYELLGSAPKLCKGNAENWWSYNDGYERGQKPKLGAVICWSKGKVGNGSDGAGHVAIVEQINSDGSIIISNSGYKTIRFYTKTLQPPYNYGTGYTFQGFIYPPITFGTPKGVSTVNIELNVLKKGSKGEQVKTLQRLLLALGYDLKSYGADGSFGNTTEATVRKFQKDKGLVVDGSVGTKTWNTILKNAR